MRNKIWNVMRSKIPEGTMLPWWALIARAILYPLDFFYWRMSCHTGYQWHTDTWLINGVTYSAAALHYLANAQGVASDRGRQMSIRGDSFLKALRALCVEHGVQIAVGQAESILLIDLPDGEPVIYGDDIMDCLSDDQA